MFFKITVEGKRTQASFDSMPSCRRAKMVEVSRRKVASLGAAAGRLKDPQDVENLRSPERISRKMSNLIKSW